MTKVIQPIKKVALFLFGVIVIALGFKSNLAHAETKSDAVEAKASEISEKAPANEASGIASDKGKTAHNKPKTKVEKAKPERAHASKGRWKKGKKGKPADKKMKANGKSEMVPHSDTKSGSSVKPKVAPEK